VKNVHVGPAPRQFRAPWAVIAPLAASLALSCSKGPGAPGPAVALTWPAADNQTIRVLDDEDLSAVGIQFTIKAQASNIGDGSTATLLIDGVVVSGSAHDVSAGEVSFPKATLEAGSHAVAVQVEDARTGKSASDSRAVLVESTAQCTFLSPKDQATLGAADDVARGTPGIQVDVQVDCPSVEAGAKLSLTVVAPSGFGGVAQVPIETTYGASGARFPAVSLGEGANLLQVQVGGSKAVAQVAVNTGRCAVWIADANDAIYNALGEQPAGMANPVVRDLNPSIAGIQAAVTAKADVAACPPGSSAALIAAGASLATAQVEADGAVHFSATLPDGDPVKAHVEVTLAGSSDAAGRSLENTYHVDSVIPEIELVAPSGPLLPAADDDPARAGLQVAAVVRATSGVDPATKVSIRDGASEILAPQGSLAPDASGLVKLQPDLTLSGGPHQLTAVAQRRLGNVGRSAPVAVDAKIVTFERVSPMFAVCNASRDEDPATKELCELTFQVKVAPADAQVTFEGTGAPTPATISPVNGIASALYSLPQSAAPFVLRVKAADPSFEASLEVQVAVDTIPPTIEFVSPAEGATVASQSSTIEVAVAGAEEKQPIVVSSDRSAAVPATVGSGEVGASQSVSISVNLPLGQQTLTASVSDAAGNAATATRSVLVDVDGCDVSLEDPSSATFIFFTGNCTGAPAWQHTVKGHTARCAQGTAHFMKTVGGMKAELGTAVVDSSGNFSFDFKPADGEADAILNVKVTKDLAPNAGIDMTYSADFTPPALDSIDPALGKLSIVHASNPNLGQAGYLADLDSSAAGGQFALSLKASGVGSIASKGQGSIAIDSVTPAFSQEYSSNAQQAVQQTFTLPEGFSGPVSVTLRDAAGNETKAKLWDATAGTLALPTPALTEFASGVVTIAKDLGGDRATYAVVQVTVAGLPGAGSNAQVALCTDLPGSQGAACKKSGYREIPGTLQTVFGASYTYYGEHAVHFGQGSQKIIAEVRDAVGSFADSQPFTVLVDTIPPVVTSVSATEEANHDGVLNAAELAPGSAAHVVATFTGVEDGQVANLYEGAVKVASAAVTGGEASFTVDDLGDGQHSFEVLVSDRVGNPNESSAYNPPIVNSADVLSLKVQRVAPSIAVVAPAFDTCNRARDKNSATEECELDFTVLVGATATEVEFSGPVTPSPARVTTFSEGRATATYALGQGGPFQLTATVKDSAGNTRQITAAVSVDAVAPTLSFVSPNNGQTLASQIVSVIVSTDAEAGQVVTVTSSRSNGNTVGQGIVAAGAAPRTATFKMALPLSSQTISATVSDAAGNVSSPAAIDVSVDIQGCDINFANPAGFSVLLNAESGPKLNITGNTTRSDCKGGVVTFYASVNGAPETQVGTAISDGVSGEFAFDHTFGDGTVTELTAAMTLGATTNRSSFTATTDITPPSLTIHAPAPNASNQLFVVAQSGNINVKNGVPGYVADADSAPGGQVSLNLTVVGGASPTGTGTGSLTIDQGSQNKVTRVLTSDASEILNPLEVTLDQKYAGPLRITVTDAAGNKATATWALRVDVVPPAAPTFIVADPGDGTFTRAMNIRHADIDAYFTTPSDDGPALQNLTWDFGYTTDFALAGSSFTDAKYDDPSVTTKVAVEPVGSPGGVALAQVRGAPTFNNVQMAPRLIDGVGNRSPIAPLAISTMGTQTGISFPDGASGTAQFGSVMAGPADIDGDGYPDFVIAAPFSTVSGLTFAGSVFVYYGGPFPLTRSQRFDGSAARAGLGRALALGDINGDSRADLLVRDGSNQIQVFLAPMSGGMLPATASFTFTHTGPLSNVRVIPDLNDDGINEILLEDSTGVGVIYLFNGRSTWPAGDVEASAADRTISGLDAGGTLGFGTALTSIPDFDGDGKPDLLLPAPGVGKLYALGSRALLAAPDITVASAAAPTIVANGISSLGSAAAALRVDADERVDLLIGASGSGYVFDYHQQSTSSFAVDAGQAPWANGPNNLGSSIIAADVNGDGRMEAVISSAGNTVGQVSVFFAKADDVLSSSPDARLAGAGRFGSAMIAGDIDGDGVLDLVVGEASNGNGTVQIFH
jgi:hypothetical protein